MRTTDLNRILDNIRSKVSLSETIRKDVKLTKKGREFVGTCPFHNEKTGSFFVNDEKGKYYCFGCGAHGDVFSYIMQSKGLTFRQALEQLAQEAGIKIQAYSIRKQDAKFTCTMEESTEFFMEQLQNSEEALAYCAKRGIDQGLIKQFRIGFCPKNILPLIEKIGIASIKAVGINKFINRLIFPIINQNEIVIAFGARTIKNEEQPKYINSPESEIFQKRETLYGYNVALKKVSVNNPFIVVEGYMDVVMMHKFGFNTAVASMGTSFSSEHLLRLWKYCKEPIICFDRDEAGYSAMQRASYIALKYIQPGKTLKFCKLPIGYDPDMYIREKSIDDMNTLLKSSLYLVDFLWQNFTDIYNDMERKTPEHIANWKKEILEKLSIINDKDLKELYIFDIKNRIFATIQNKKNLPKNNGKFFVNIKDNSLLRESILLYIVIKFTPLLHEVSEQLSRIVFSNKLFVNIRDCLLNEEELDKSWIDNLRKIAGRYCNFNQEDALAYWHDVFNNHVSKIEYSKDLKLAKKNLNNEFKGDSWERLKALKLGLLKR